MQTVTVMSHIAMGALKLPNRSWKRCILACCLLNRTASLECTTDIARLVWQDVSKLHYANEIPESVLVSLAVESLPEKDKTGRCNFKRYHTKQFTIESSMQCPMSFYTHTSSQNKKGRGSPRNQHGTLQRHPPDWGSPVPACVVYETSENYCPALPGVNYCPAFQGEPWSAKHLETPNFLE